MEEKFDVMHRDNELGFGIGANRFDDLAYHPEENEIHALNLKDSIKVGKG